MVAAGDPVANGLVESLARPRGNVTGLSQMLQELGGKRLELLKEIVPPLSRVAVFWNPQSASATLSWKENQLPARQLGIQLAPEALLRTRATAPQHLLTREERRRNVQGAFTVASAARSRIAGADLLLVDDVMTSGATLDAASAAMKAAGAASVSVAVVARTP